MSKRGVYYTKSPLLASRTPIWRSRFLIVCLAFGFLALTARAAWVQLYKYEFYQDQADLRYMRTLPLVAERGKIFDRNGTPLASSVRIPSLWASPSEVKATDSQLEALANLLEMDLGELKNKLDPGSEGRKREFVWLKRLAGNDLALKVKNLGIKGIYSRDEFQRDYPGRGTTAQIVGFTNIEDVGQEGIELAYNDYLTGAAGYERIIRDRRGNPVGYAEDRKSPHEGKPIYLSIDMRIQHYAYQVLQNAVIDSKDGHRKAKSASVVILDTQTGEILALANYPSYDPNDRQNLHKGQLRNLVMTDIFEPGSTVKPFVVARALDLGIVKPDTMIKTAPGSVVISGKEIRDVGRYQQLTVQQVIQKSSNIGIVTIAMKMTPQELWDTYTGIGFGQKPQIDFPGVAVGRLRPYKSWRPIEHATQAYGYGLSVSLLQLAHAYTVFARDGELIPLTLRRRDTTQAVQGVKVFTPQTASAVREMLHMAAMPGGAARAQIYGYAVGGKSGTSKVSTRGGYSESQYRAWFVGIAPINRPRIIVAVMVDDPQNGYYGGLIAAPVFSDVASKTLSLLGVPPDSSVLQEAVVAESRRGG